MLYDGHGSTRQLIGTVDNSRTAEFSNLRISTYDFDAYGIELPQTATSQAKPQANSEETNLRYSGEFFDKDLNQQYLRARYYNQNNGQFNRLDPYSGNLSDPQSLHKYAYCHQDPVNHIDPSGNFSLTEIMIVSSIIGTLSGIVTYAFTSDWKVSLAVAIIVALFTAALMVLWPRIVAMFRYQLAHTTLSKATFEQMIRLCGSDVLKRCSFIKNLGIWRLIKEVLIGYGQQLFKVVIAPAEFIIWFTPTPAGAVGLVIAVVSVVVYRWLKKKD